MPAAGNICRQQSVMLGLVHAAGIYWKPPLAGKEAWHLLPTPAMLPATTKHLGRAETDRLVHFCLQAFRPWF